MNLFLIGYRGTGKSAVARRLGLALGRPWVDADVELELRAGKSIASIFADEGEPAFRDLETAVLSDLAQRHDQVVACGGGVVLREANRAKLRAAGRVVWLKAAPETILARVAQDAATASRRPALTTSGGLAEVVQLLEVRTPWYRQCADWEIETDDRSPEEIAREIVERMNLTPPGRESA